MYLAKLSPDLSVEENENTQKISLGLKILPNPVVDNAKIEYQLPTDTKVTLKIYDISGRVVDKLIDNVVKPKGVHSVPWHGKDIPAGVYFCRLKTEASETVKKILLLR
jgi:flagellar hook assembly protein FlgD